jgi:hypothetical protein
VYVKVGEQGSTGRPSVVHRDPAYTGLLAAPLPGGACLCLLGHLSVGLTGGEDLAAVDVDEVWRDPNGGGEQVETGQQFASVLMRQGEGGFAVEVRHVEHLVSHRHGGQRRAAGAAHVHAVLKPMERGAAGVVERDDLAIEYGIPPG